MQSNFGVFPFNSFHFRPFTSTKDDPKKFLSSAGIFTLPNLTLLIFIHCISISKLEVIESYKSQMWNRIPWFTWGRKDFRFSQRDEALRPFCIIFSTSQSNESNLVGRIWYMTFQIQTMKASPRQSRNGKSWFHARWLLSIIKVSLSFGSVTIPNISVLIMPMCSYRCKRYGQLRNDQERNLDEINKVGWKAE